MNNTKKISNAQPHLPPATSSSNLDRGLSSRHIQFLGFGGAIGSGLFMGAGKTISMSGTSIILTYLLIGIVLFFVMRAMGELLLSNLNYKTFADFCSDYIGPWAGFFIGWSYWLTYIVAGVIDFLVIGAYLQYWYPHLPAWIPALALLFSLLALNLITVKVFGEMEFWFTLIKVVAIIFIIVGGITLIATHHVMPNGVTASLGHLFDPDAFLPNGLVGFYAGFQIALFSFAGIEMIGTTAGEAENPEKTLPKAINSVPLRVMVFYVLSIACIIGVCSWKEISPDNSPFVQLFIVSGLPIAAALMNLVLTSSAISASNSAVFCTSRTLFGLAGQKQAPGRFGVTTKSRVPGVSLWFSCGCIGAGISLLIVIPQVMKVFTLVSTVAAVLLIFIWSLMLVAYLIYRKRRPDLHAASRYKMPFGIVASVCCLVFFGFTVWVMTLQPDTLLALSVMPLWFLWLTAVYALSYKKTLKAKVQRYRGPGTVELT
ncbi:amino acid permease [Pseudomonas sp. NBRC 111131]|uniref:amino acid permease n=1 Tax=Pseudomonas sp. NBRC 111131 TaxID=1661046 RepID=UPI0006D41D0A